MTDLLKELRRLAEQATPGPWKIGYTDGSGGYDEEQGKFCLVNVDDSCVLHARLCDSVFDAKFIAAANPQTILALLDALEAAMRGLEGIGGKQVGNSYAWKKGAPTSFQSHTIARDTLAEIRRVLGGEHD